MQPPQSSGAAPGVPAPDPRRWRSLTVCLAVGFMTMLDVSIVNVALPSIESVLGAGPSELQLIVAGYTLAFGLVLVPAGRLGDVRGRRLLFVIGLVGFGVTSLLAGMATTGTMLAVARLAQGATAGLLNPQVVGLIQQLFSGAERGKAFGLFGAVIGVSTAIGPLAGGILITGLGAEHGWRWVFWINVPVAAVVLPLALRWLPPNPRRGEPVPLDVIGVALTGLFTAAVMVPFVLVSTSGDDGRRWWWLAVAAVLMVALVRWERWYGRRTGAAVFDARLLGEPGFSFGATLGMAYFAGFTSVFLVVTLFLQGQLGYSALQAGAVGMPFAVASGVASQRSGALVARYGRRLVVVGILIALCGLAGIMAALRWVDPAQAGWAIAAAMLVTGAGNGLVISPNQTLTLAEVPVVRAGVAGSALQVGQRIGSAIGVAAALAIYYAALGGGATGETAAGRALLLTTGALVVALVVALADSRRRAA